MKVPGGVPPKNSLGKWEILEIPGRHDKIYWKSRGFISKNIDILKSDGTIFLLEKHSHFLAIFVLVLKISIVHLVQNILMEVLLILIFSQIPLSLISCFYFYNFLTKQLMKPTTMVDQPNEVVSRSPYFIFL